ncbi:MAG: hypothetical protein J6A67_00485 [Clostridia bacterium]|nr:hypothetical protein [Clostridia bacterium]
MTRKEALKKSIDILSEFSENIDITGLLQDIHDELPLIHWTDKSIRDTVEQFIIDNGRVPTATDFKKKGMPPHPVFKQKYSKTLAEWLMENYPVSKVSSEELKLKHTENFKKDYERIKPKTKEEFNKNSSKGTLSWQSVAKYYDCTSWNKLIDTLDLPKYVDQKQHPTIKVNIITDYDFLD